MAKDDLSGADIKAVCTEAGMLALRERRMRVTKADFTAAREKVSWTFELRVTLLSRCRFCTGRTKALPKACICSLLSIINLHFHTLSFGRCMRVLQGDYFSMKPFVHAHVVTSLSVLFSLEPRTCYRSSHVDDIVNQGESYSPVEPALH